MDGAENAFEKFFRIGQPVKVGIHLAENLMLEEHAVIRGMEGDRMKLELWGSSLADRGGAETGAVVTVVADAGYSIYRCTAALEKETTGRTLSLVVSGGIREKQLREYFRFDLCLPVAYSIPENQTLTSVISECRMNRIRQRDIPPPVMEPCRDGFKVVRWDDLNDLLPERINLSGGGLRLRMPDYTEPGTLVQVNLFLPLVPPRVICEVAEVLRCNEMMLLWSKGNSYSTAMRFHCIDEKDRETIISHIFMEQRRSLQVMKAIEERGNRIED
jgi:Family of unknown function (DUF5634) N-terminal domain/PilZ domain